MPGQSPSGLPGHIRRRGAPMDRRDRRRRVRTGDAWQRRCAGSGGTSLQWRPERWAGRKARTASRRKSARSRRPASAPAPSSGCAVRVRPGQPCRNGLATKSAFARGKRNPQRRGAGNSPLRPERGSVPPARRPPGHSSSIRPLLKHRPCCGSQTRAPTSLTRDNPELN